MPVFKTYIKILKKNMFSSIIYLIIFIALAILLASAGKTDSVNVFTATSVNLGVVDRDQSEISKEIIRYLSESHNIVALADDTEVLQDELYYRNVSYILIIPEHLEENLMNGSKDIFECIKIPNSDSGVYVDIQIEQLLKTIRTFLIAGYSSSDAVIQAKQVLSNTTEVSLLPDETTTEAVPDYYYYFKFIPYILMGLMINIISYNLFVFHQGDVQKRSICSSLPLKNQNLQLALGTIITSVVVYIFLMLVPIPMYGTKLLQTKVLPYYLLNSFTYLFVCMSLGYLAGIVAKTKDSVSAITTISSLGLSFLGGVFVPLSVMSDKVLAFAKFVPSYWYTIANDTLMNLTVVTKSVRSEIFTAIFVQLVFAFALFCIALVLSRRRVQEA